MPELIPAISVAPDPWAGLRRHTPARIALGSSGNSLPTADVLELGMAHSHAPDREAVHQCLDVAGLGAAGQSRRIEMTAFKTGDILCPS